MLLHPQIVRYSNGTAKALYGNCGGLMTGQASPEEILDLVRNLKPEERRHVMRYAMQGGNPAQGNPEGAVPAAPPSDEKIQAIIRAIQSLSEDELAQLRDALKAAPAGQLDDDSSKAVAETAVKEQVPYAAARQGLQVGRYSHPGWNVARYDVKSGYSVPDSFFGTKPKPSAPGVGETVVGGLLNQIAQLSPAELSMFKAELSKVFEQLSSGKPVKTYARVGDVQRYSQRDGEDVSAKAARYAMEERRLGRTCTYDQAVAAVRRGA